MRSSHKMLPGLLCLAALALFFCLWSASGNGVNLCRTAGCTLFQDATLAGFSLWWFGACAFALMALMALMGAAWWGHKLATLLLVADMGLLLLMASTAPCVNCLMAAVFFALLYCGFRRANFYNTQPTQTSPPRSFLLLLWGLLFIVNVGTAIRGEFGVWALTDNAGDATVRMFFSPSCPSCREGITLLSGHVDVAFFPVEEDEQDVRKVALMRQYLAQGASMVEALEQAQSPSSIPEYSPDLLLLRLHMLRNKAHVFLAGSTSIPFFEYQGLPSMLRKRETPRPTGAAPSLHSPSSDNAILPLDPQIAGQCSGSVPCP
ncbi:MAG: hypothetical protein J5861_08390 [Desulfovibrio sp.]|nr:hypothetical protein [Desulfovibrio sp.]